jgi:hypothetical protein
MRRITGTSYTSKYLTTEQIKNYLIDCVGYSQEDLEDEETLSSIVLDMSDEEVIDMEQYSGV